MRVFLIMILALLLSCRNHPTSIHTQVSTSNIMGAFSVSLVKGLQKLTKSSSPADTGTTRFDLGDLKSSSSFYFLVSNAGTIPITNVTISISSSFLDSGTGFVQDTASLRNISVSPNAISTLEPMLVTSALKLDIVHGNTLNGVGWTSLLKQGQHEAVMLLSGSTKEMTITTSVTGQDTSRDTTYKDTIVSTKCRIAFYAKIMDASFAFDSTLIDSSLWQIMTGGIGTPHIDSLFMNFRSMQIKNTGNVPIILTVSQDSSIGGTNIRIYNLKDTLDAGSTVSFPIQQNIASLMFLELSLDGGNTIADITKRFYQDAFGVVQFNFPSFTYKHP